MVQIAIPYAYGCTVRVYAYGSYVPYAYGTKYAYGIRLNVKTHAVICNSDLPIHVYGTSLLNHLNISGSTEVSSLKLLVDPLTTLVLIG